MPVNKNANIRYRALDRCFRDTRRKYFIDDLIAACEAALREFNFEGSISRRQIFDDIRYMKSDSGYSIELDEHLYDGKRRYYRYADPDFSINRQPLSQAEARQLLQAVTTLTRFRGLPQYEWIEEVIASLRHRFNIDSPGAAIVSFEQNPTLRGLEHLAPLIDAITSGTVLEISYHTYKDGGHDMTFVVHPYYLKQYNNRWFLFGRNDATAQVTVIALDRIRGMEPVPDITYIATDINFEHYFDNIVGVTIPDDPTVVAVVFRATEQRFPYIISKPLHPSQRVVDRQQRTLQINVAPNFELVQTLLSFGPDIEVLAPESLRLRIATEVAEAYKKYFNVEPLN